MNVSTLFQLVHTPIYKSDLKRLIDIDDIERKINNIPNNDKLLDLAKYLNVNVNDLYFIDKTIFKICYYKDVIFLELNSYDCQQLEFINAKERIEAQKSKFNELIQKNDWETLFFLIDSKIKFMIYKELYDKIPDNIKYDIFINIYIKGEYGFSFFDMEFIKNILSYKPKKTNNSIKNKIKNIKNNKITIYRGVGSESTSLDKAYSWTTNLNVALSFATRFNEDGKVYQAEVDINNIIEYITNRNEYEVLILPEHIENVKLMSLISFVEIIDELEQKGIVEMYHDFVYELEQISYLINNLHGIHGITHIKRVLLLTLILSDALNLNYDDVCILAQAAIYHDIGRKNDCTCYQHGYESYNKLNELNILFDTDDEESQCLKYIIEQHALSDDIGKDNIKNYNIKNKEHAIYLLNIFKDCDGLDRVRLKDLNINYLRNEKSKNLILLAYQLLRNIK